MSSQDNVAYGPRHDNLDNVDAVSEASAFHDTEEFELDDAENVSGTRGQEPAVRYKKHYLSSPRVTTIIQWFKGPQPPKKQVIVPWYLFFHQAPRRLLDKYIRKRWKLALLLIFYYLIWAATFTSVLVYWKDLPAEGATNFDGTLQQLGCGDTLWLPGNGCGLNGDDCRPFDGSFAFRCPPGCASYQLLNPRAVGAQEIDYQPLVIGGPIYRGDSFICAAGIHAGMISDNEGGCGVTSRVAGNSDFPSSTQNNIASVGFDSQFPLSFKFLPEFKSSCNGIDLQWVLFAISIVWTAILSMFTMSASVFFYSTFVVAFVQVALVSDPPNDGTIPLASLVSILTGSGLPAIFCAVVLYHTCIRPTLKDLTANIDKTVLWLGGCWVAAVSNRTFELIPISRLTPHDLNQQPGAKAALSAVVIVLVAVVVHQAYYFRLEGRLPRYLAIYGILAAGLLIALSPPGLSLRIHHYILALLLLPGTSIQTRPSLLYQGILVGLFINGIARWGFAGILQTAADLQGDGFYNSLLPTILDPTISLAAGSSLGNITFSWVIPATGQGLDGISILVNDAERFRSYFSDIAAETNFTWSREAIQPEYFRFGYLSGSNGLDYTQAGVLSTNMTWTKMKDGPS